MKRCFTNEQVLELLNKIIENLQEERCEYITNVYESGYDDGMFHCIKKLEKITYGIDNFIKKHN